MKRKLFAYLSVILTLAIWGGPSEVLAQEIQPEKSINHNQNDKENPIIDMDSVAISETEVTVGDTILFTVKVTDNIGISRVLVYLKNSDDVSNIVQKDLEYNNETEQYESLIEIDENMPAGEWVLDHIEAFDTSENFELKSVVNLGFCVTDSKSSGQEMDTLVIENHQYDSWITIVAPTLENIGERQRKCRECGDIQKETVVKLTGKWKQNSAGWWYELSDGSYLKNCLITIGSKVYYFNSKGYMQTSWQDIDEKRYYFNGSGHLQYGWINIGANWYYTDSTGVMLTGIQTIGEYTYYLSNSGVREKGWKKVDDNWYYFNDSGRMQKGWLYLKENWYYADSSGVMLTGFQKIGTKTYYMNGSGIMQKGFRVINGQKYYFNDSGHMQTSWLYIEGTWYYFNTKDGVMLTEQWLNNIYYLKSSGAMAVGWHLLGDNYYYFLSDGKKAIKCWIGEYYLKHDGIMAKNEWVDGWKYYVDNRGKRVPNAAIPGTVLTGTGGKENYIDLSWEEISGAMAYEIYRATTVNGPYTKLVDLNVMDYSDSDVQLGNTYYYKVRAYNYNGPEKIYSPYSNVVQIKVGSIPRLTVKEEEVNAAHKINIMLKEKIPNAGGYDYYVSVNGKEFTMFATSGSAVPKTAYTVKHNDRYQFKVQMYSTVNGKKVYGSFSDPVIYQCEWMHTGKVYQVGKDIPEGIYYFQKDVSDKIILAGSYSIYADPDCVTLVHHNFVTTSKYLLLKEGDYLDIADVRFVPADNAPYPIQNANGTYGDRTYRVGRDISAGEYEARGTDPGYVGSYDLKSSCTKEEYSNVTFLGNNNVRRIVLQEGQYIELSSVTLKKIN